MNKLVTLEQLTNIVDQARSNGKKIAWTNGCFDIIHAGHVDYLEKSKSYGGLLIIGMNSDESVKMLKGELRPIFSEMNRAKVLCSIVYVDYVVIFSERSPIKMIELLKPDYYIKGGDYTIDTIDQAERKVVESYGGEIVLLPMVKGVSSSIIVGKIKKLSDI
ncbi:MAG: D-glycero-beta-D-manno-heptose 1-phosphate adenylyltransferase [bacterium]|nr:MAG: D-glycero-beta-D-manno-heptose 1-phosphate adenylyltransferase [bacterium]